MIVSEMTRIRQLAEASPGMPLVIALEILKQEAAEQNALQYHGDPGDKVSLAEFASGQPSVMQYLQSPDIYKKILAIKELRMMSAAGLKEAKEAVEYLCEHILLWGKPTGPWGSY